MFPTLSHQYCVHDSLIEFNQNLPILIAGVRSNVDIVDGSACFEVISELAFLDADASFQDHAAGLMAHLLWWLSAGRIKLEKILLPHSKPENEIRYHAFFGCAVIFDSAKLAVCFEEKHLREPISTSAPFAKKSTAKQWNGIYSRICHTTCVRL